MSIYIKLAQIQKDLKAPKNQWNDFSKFKYRSCEDILEGLKLVIGDLVVTMSDDIKMIGDRIYVVATVTLSDGKESISNTAFARESLTKKGMDDSQITGTASSYARKYALNGMFLIDDTKDADSMDNSNQASQAAPKQAKAIDHSAIIKQYTDADQGQRDLLWASINEDQRTAINKSFEGK
jgi:hypothetical protein